MRALRVLVVEASAPRVRGFYRGDVRDASFEARVRFAERPPIARGLTAAPVA